MNVKMKHLMTALIASAAVSQAVHAQEAPSAVAQDTKQVEQAANGMANKVVGWLDKLSDSVRTLGKKSEEWSKDAATYKDQLKEQWPSIKEQFNQKLSEGMEKGQQSKEAVSKWLDETFSQERINKAEEWMTNFKNGVTDNVVDPLVPYLLAMRYPNPMDEWNQGYRREYPVSIKGMDRPLQVTLPLSWNLSQNLQLGQNEFMSWRSESGSGQYVVALIETPTGATVDSIVAGLQKARPDAVTEKLPNSQIVRVYFPAKTDTENAVYYYAVPAGDQVFTVCGEVLRGKDEKTDALNQRLQAESDFFNAVASNIFVKPAS